jgi:hypothetical protein
MFQTFLMLVNGQNVTSICSIIARGWVTAEAHFEMSSNCLPPYAGMSKHCTLQGTSVSDFGVARTYSYLLQSTNETSLFQHSNHLKKFNGQSERGSPAQL